MNLYVRVKVKFRAFGITLGTVDQTVHFWLNQQGFGFATVEMPEPPLADVVFDKRGVRVSAWQ